MRHEIQNIDEIMDFLADVRFRAISDLCSTVSLLSSHRVIAVWGFFLVFFGWLVFKLDCRKMSAAFNPLSILKSTSVAGVAALSAPSPPATQGWPSSTQIFPNVG